MGLTDQQAQAAYAPGSVAVTAGAGTGKTHMLAERYLYFLRQGISPLEMVAVTFTTKAATEMRSRIRQALAAQMADRPDLLAELEAAQISTFHALAARICREHPDRAEVPPDFTLLEEFDSPLWQAEQLADVLAQLPSDVYRTVPFSQMREILAVLLTDPLTAEQALRRERADWLARVDAIRQQALADLLGQAQWQWGRSILDTYSAPGDKLEDHRRAGLAAIAALEHGHAVAPSLQTLASLKINVGSAKNWGDKATLATVKDAIRALRTLAEDALKAGLVTLAPNAYDDQTEAMLPTIRDAFTQARQSLQAVKYQQRLLDFNDLEVHALKALAHSEVRTYYAQRWRVFLIDEFQDTNPTQGSLLKALTQDATLTIVGDVKQSIYSFRRADVRVFQSWQRHLHPEPDQPVALSRSFRTHQSLMAQINQVFAPVLADLHQPLEAQRNEALHPAPQIQLYTVVVEEAHSQDDAINTPIDACRRVEAQKIAALVEEMLATPVMVQDKHQGELHPLQPGDIAILGRTWAPLELYGAAIAARNIPILQAGGGNLLDTREAKDAWALLRWLADPTDNLSLAAVLRSPFFAVSDLTLYLFVQSLPPKTSWWKHLSTADLPDWHPIVHILKALLVARRTEAPSRLLQMADRLTGYTAVIANLAGAARRLADWRGFLEQVRTLEQGSSDGLNVVRRLSRIAAGGAEMPRPALEGGNAVSLMTIHGSKGLEWPVVIVPDLSHSSPSDSPRLRFDAELGVALKLEDEAGDPQKSALYTLLEQRQRQDTQAENKRILYVALTRARDQLILTAAKPAGGNLDLLQPGLEGWLEPIPIPFDPALAQPVEPVAPALSTDSRPHLIPPTGSGFSDLPVTALSDYALCPLRFRFSYVDGHPGYLDGDSDQALAMDIGKLTHKALELRIQDPKQLKKHAYHLADTAVQEAFDLAQRFHQAEIYAPYRQALLQWEQPISLTLDGLTLNGVVDLVGRDFVLDFKTDRDIRPDHHQFQLWAYRKATGRQQAYLAYLRHDRVYRFDPQLFNQVDQSAAALIHRLKQGDFGPTPDPHRCGRCPYGEVCESRIISN